MLHELKRRGYRIVHVTPATPERPKTVTEPSQWIAHAHGRQTWPGSVIVLPQPSQTSFGNNQPLDVRPAVAAPIQQRGRPVLHPLQVPQPSDPVWPRGFSGSQAVLATTHSPLPAPNPAVSYPETSFAPSLQGNTPLMPPEPDALDMASAPLESGAPADSAAPQSPAKPLLAPRDPVSTAPPLMTPRDLVSTAKMPHGPFP